jgi:hypothetical protein
MNKLLVLCLFPLALLASEKKHKWDINDPEKNISFLLGENKFPRTQESENLNALLLKELALQKVLKEEIAKNEKELRTAKGDKQKK